MIARFTLLICSLVSLLCFALPMFVIRPFRHQGARELALALFVKQIGPELSMVCAAIAVGILLFKWKTAQGWAERGLMAAALLLALSGAYMSRLNIYERMFHHLGAPQFESAQTASIDGDDMVLAVRVNGEARAYPIREMAYHHVVNDTVGGLPIVSTY